MPKQNLPRIAAATAAVAGYALAGAALLAMPTGAAVSASAGHPTTVSGVLTNVTPSACGQLRNYCCQID